MKPKKSHVILGAPGKKAQSLRTAQHQPCDTENKLGCQYLIPRLSEQASDVLVPTHIQPKVYHLLLTSPCPFPQPGSTAIRGDAFSLDWGLQPAESPRQDRPHRGMHTDADDVQLIAVMLCRVGTLRTR